MIPDENNAAVLFEVTQDIMERAGMPAYEVSNHAFPGQESKHNLTYWYYGDYVGIGPGAHGRITVNGIKKATRGHKAPDVWLQKTQTQGHGSHPFEDIEPQQKFTEALIMGLRLWEGIKLPRLETVSGGALNAFLDMKKIKHLESEGFIVFDGLSLRTTPAGMLRLNAILAYLL